MNKLKVLILLVAVIVAAECSSVSDSSSSESGEEGVVRPTEPLFLSRYIKSGNIEQGRKLAAVKQPELLKKGIESYSGYFTVDETHDSNLFFWYFPAKNNQKNAPLIVWLQGGPGASSLYGLFMENGPVYVGSKDTLLEREYSWNKNLNVLYIDNPVGAGFSFTNSSAGYLTNQVDVGINLFSCLQQFLQVFSELRNNDVYISGESYAGKYVPALAYRIYLNKSIFSINLKGIYIGNGVTDPINQIQYGQLLHELGFIDQNNLQTFIDRQNNATALIAQGQYYAALSYVFSLIDTQTSLFNQLTGFTSPYNFLVPNGYNDQIDVVSSYLINSTLSKYLNVGNNTFVAFADNNPVLVHFANDILASVAPWLEVILDNYKVSLCSGMLDILAAPRLIENYLLKLNFTGAAALQAATASIWTVNNEIAGYERSAGNLKFRAVRLAGHMVPHDQPEWAFNIISELTGT